MGEQGPHAPPAGIEQQVQVQEPESEDGEGELGLAGLEVVV